MLHALKMDNVVKDNVLMEDVKLVSLKVNPEHSVTDMKIVQEREKLPAVLESQPLTHTSQSASHLWQRTWFVVQSTSLEMSTLGLKYKRHADHVRKD